MMNRLFSRQLIIESIASDLFELASGKITEYGSIDHIQELERMENELRSLKGSMQRGPDRLTLRKEKATLQRAIESIRYLKTKAERAGKSKGLLKT